MITGPHWFHRQKYKKEDFAPEYTQGPRQGDIFHPRVYSGSTLRVNNVAQSVYGKS